MAYPKATDVYVIFVKEDDETWYYLNSYTSTLGVKKAVSRLSYQHEVQVFHIYHDGSVKPVNVRS